MKIKYIVPLFLLAISMACITCQNSPSNGQQASMFPRGAVQHLDRFESEIQAFEQADKTAMPEEGSILFVGSSSIRKWSSLAGDFAPLPVINRGFGGSTIAEVNYYADRIVYKYKPRVIVFYCGENDIAEKTPVAVVFQDFKKFIGETEKNLRGVPVVYISAKPSPARWDKWRQFQTLNKMIEQFAKGRPGLHFVDISQALLGENGQPDPSLFVEDGLHMNEKGYEKWTALLRPVVEELYVEKIEQ